MARAGGWPAQVRVARATVIMMLLALFLIPQKATAASDFKDRYLFYDYSLNKNEQSVTFHCTYFDETGEYEGFIKDNGLYVDVSRDGGANWSPIFQIRATTSGGWDIKNGWQGCDGGNGAWTENNEHKIRCKWWLPLQYRNCNLIFRANGWWRYCNGSSESWKYKEFGDKDHPIFAESYTFTVRDHYWNGEPTVSADGTVTVPYKFGGAANTDGETLLFPRINGQWNGTINFRNPPSNYSAGSYTFNLTDLGADMRTKFTIEPIHEFIHKNDKDASNGRKDYWKSAGVKTILPMPLATLENPVFNQASRNVVLKWTADNTNYGNGKWVIYRNGTKIGTVSQGTYTYTDQNPTNNAGTTFPYESNVKYFIYYVANGWAETTQRSELKSNEVTVNTTRKVPVNNPSAVSQANRIVFTWTSDGYPANWGNQFKIYIDNVLAYTLTPSANQTSFRWDIDCDAPGGCVYLSRPGLWQTVVTTYLRTVSRRGGILADQRGRKAQIVFCMFQNRLSSMFYFAWSTRFFA